MRLLHEIAPDENIVCRGEYHYFKAGQPTGQIEQWQITRLPGGAECTRVEISGQGMQGRVSLLSHLQRNPNGRPEWLRLRYESGTIRAAAQYNFEDANIRIIRQAENEIRRQEILDIALGYVVDYHPVIAHDYVWRGYPAHARGKAWSIPVFSLDLWSAEGDLLGGRVLRFTVSPQGIEELSTHLGDFEQARLFEITLSDGARAMGWYDEFGIPLRWTYPDKGFDFVLMNYERLDKQVYHHTAI